MVKAGGRIEEDAGRLLRLATTASVATASVLIVGKLGAWLHTGSVSVLASLIDSLMDVVASSINLLAVRYSLTPADAEHRFGHGKAESLAGLAQATFIGGSAVFLLLHAVERMINPRPLADVAVGVAVMVFAIAATAVLLGIQRHVIRRTGSTAIRADSLHYTTDLLTNLSAIVALGLAAVGWGLADPLFGIAIGLYILYSAWGIGHDASQHLMDRELPEHVRRRVHELALAHPDVRGVHDIRTRRSGRQEIIQLHLEMDGDMALKEAHAAADAVAAAIREEFPGADITIHQDPANPGAVD